ncbi:MAG TPA: hypothetical protein VK806_08140 [Bacteroidia bacterium]|jgi:hypothetical protein|nr:hypothetical protein [Bacteroidia bacterium]
MKKVLPSSLPSPIGEGIYLPFQRERVGVRAKGVYKNAGKFMNRFIENQHVKGIQVSKSVYPVFLHFSLWDIMKNCIKSTGYQIEYLKNATQNINLCQKVLHFLLSPKGDRNASPAWERKGEGKQTLVFLFL